MSEREVVAQVEQLLSQAHQSHQDAMEFHQTLIDERSKLITYVQTSQKNVIAHVNEVFESVLKFLSDEINQLERKKQDYE